MGRELPDHADGGGDQLGTWEETPGEEVARCTGQVTGHVMGMTRSNE